MFNQGCSVTYNHPKCMSLNSLQCTHQPQLSQPLTVLRRKSSKFRQSFLCFSDLAHLQIVSKHSQYTFFLIPTSFKTHVLISSNSRCSQTHNMVYLHLSPCTLIYVIAHWLPVHHSWPHGNHTHKSTYFQIAHQSSHCHMVVIYINTSIFKTHIINSTPQTSQKLTRYYVHSTEVS